MARKQITEIKYICDVCGRTCISPERSRWFKIARKEDGYLCSNCFHQDLDKFRKWLYALGIQVDYSFNCTQYADYDSTGYIEIRSASRQVTNNIYSALKLIKE